MDTSQVTEYRHLSSSYRYRHSESLFIPLIRINVPPLPESQESLALWLLKEYSLKHISDCITVCGCQVELSKLSGSHFHVFEKLKGNRYTFGGGGGGGVGGRWGYNSKLFYLPSERSLS